MAAALQQTPITLQSRLPLSTRITAKFHAYRTTTRVPFHGGGFSSSAVKTLKLAVRHNGKSRGSTLRVKAFDSPAESYASALADVAVENGTLEATAADVEKVAKLFSDPEVSEFFSSPVIVFDQKQEDMENGTLEATAADVEKVAKLFSDPEVSEFFSSPVIVFDQKQEVIQEMASEAKLQPHTTNFLNILIENDRTEMIDEIVKEFEMAYNKLTDTEVAVVSSVVKLESQHLAQIAKGVQRLTGAKNVRIKTVIDPSLVAGFTVRYGDTGSRMIDMSVKKQLEDLSSQPDFMDFQLA